ncbi:MAG: formylglycine-generating enzyme family protein [Chloroflexi bacterium]|nr:formylglycine-generating enzyme family protein [Chloroflexota bacterium]
MTTHQQPSALLVTLSVLTGMLLTMCGMPDIPPEAATRVVSTATPRAPGSTTAVAVGATTLAQGTSDVPQPVDAGVAPDTVLVPAGNGVAAFRIGRTEVTNAQYAQCVAAGTCTAPVPYSDRCHYSNAVYAEHPVVCVTRAQAEEYAAWIGGTLPTDAQWTRACKGDDGRTYPWGEEAPDERLANFSIAGRQAGDLTAVGSYPAGASPYGVLDMAGNAPEWVQSDPGDGEQYIRGGAFFNNAADVVCSTRFQVGGANADLAVGFRVVAPAP